METCDIIYIYVYIYVCVYTHIVICFICGKVIVNKDFEVILSVFLGGENTGDEKLCKFTIATITSP